jgi:hypothetical protein
LSKANHAFQPAGGRSHADGAAAAADADGAAGDADADADAPHASTSSTSSSINGRVQKMAQKRPWMDRSRSIS